MQHGGLPPEYMDKEKFMCEECPAIFLEKRKLCSHKMNFHGHGKPQNRNKKKCPFCDKQYNHSTPLREHVLKVHDKNTPFHCSKCPRKFGL